MAGIISGQLIEPAHNRTVSAQQSGGVAVESSSIVTRFAAASVSYVLGGIPYVDTLAAGAVAQLWGGGGSTLFDPTTKGYTTFIVAALGGAATLYVTPNDNLATVADSQDIVPLDVVYRHQIRYYQPRQFGSKSFLGGASLSGATYQIGQVSNSFPATLCTVVDTWIYPLNAPSMNSTIWSVAGSSSTATPGSINFTLFLRPDMLLETTGTWIITLTDLSSVTASHTFTWDLAAFGGALSLNTWYWISARIMPVHVHVVADDGCDFYFQAGVYDHTGTLLGATLSSELFTVNNGSVGTVGSETVYEVISQQSYLTDVSWGSPGQTDFRLSKCEWVNSHINPPLGPPYFGASYPPGTPYPADYGLTAPPPTADRASGSTYLFYSCRQPLGPATTLTDSGSAGINASASPGDLTILLPGPYPT